MADQETQETPSPAVTTAAVRPKRVSHRGRSAGLKASSNKDESKIEEFEPFMLLPRGPPPLKGEMCVSVKQRIHDTDVKRFVYLNIFTC